MTTTCVEDNKDAVAFSEMEMLESSLRVAKDEEDEGDNGVSAQKLDSLNEPIEKDDEKMVIVAVPFIRDQNKGSIKIDEYVKVVSAKKAQKEDDPCRLLQLSTDLQADIFSRLPSFKEICLVRSVCKDISFITESPDFISMRLGRADPEIFLLANPLVNDFMTMHKLDLHGTSNNVPQAMNVQYKAFLPKWGTTYMDSTIGIVNTCNGFVCLSGPHSLHYSNPRVICNPVTREYVFIPKLMKPEEYVRCWSEALGFGCNTEGKDYKVVRLVDGRSLSNLISIFAEVYRLGDDSWKTIGIVPNVGGLMGSSVFLNGVIYRMCIGRDSSVYILCFEVEFERVSSLHFPSCFSPYECYHTEITVLRGFLCVSRVVELRELEIWVMMDGSWTKMLTVKPPPCLNHFGWKPLSWSENKDMVFLCERKMLVCYNLLTGTVRGFEVKGDSITEKYQAFTLEPNFGSLKDTFKGENFEIHNFRPEDVTNDETISLEASNV